MVSAVWDPSASRSKLLSAVTPKKLWGKEGAIPLNLSVCLSMCLIPEQQQQGLASVTAASGFSVLRGSPSCAAGFSNNSVGNGNHSPTNQSVASFYSCVSSVQSGSAAAAGVLGQNGQGLRGLGHVEPVWVNSELVVRVCPADASFKAVRAFK
jgi:hypothetical protein